MAVPKNQFEVSKMLMDLSTPDLKAPEKWLLVLLSHYGDEVGLNIYPSLETLAAASCMSKRAVIDNIRKLKEKGYIHVRKGGRINGQNVSNTYSINMVKLGFEYGDGVLIETPKVIKVIEKEPEVVINEFDWMKSQVAEVKVRPNVCKVAISNKPPFVETQTDFFKEVTTQ